MQPERTTMNETDLKDIVRERYGSAVKAALAGASSSCCGSSTSCSPSGGKDPITRDLYTKSETAGLPAEALTASFGCGNPTALLELRAGETVLDLGSGGGIDVLLSAKRVGPTGKAIGLDMTPEMLALSRENQAKSGLSNVEFLEGTIEAIPLPQASVDVVISNCVINLSGDKPQVLREAFRVLRPGGRFAVSDVVLLRALPELARRSMELWTGCVAGALEVGEYRAALSAAGFVDIEVETTRTFGSDDASSMAASACCSPTDKGELAQALDGAVASAFVRARKPA